MWAHDKFNFNLMGFYFTLRIILISLLTLIKPISPDIISSILAILRCKSILTILVECQMFPEDIMEKAIKILIEKMSKNDTEWSIIIEKNNKNKSALEKIFNENPIRNNLFFYYMFKLVGLHKDKSSKYIDWNLDKTFLGKYLSKRPLGIKAALTGTFSKDNSLENLKYISDKFRETKKVIIYF